MKLLLDMPIVQLLQSRALQLPAPPPPPKTGKSFAVDLVAAQDLVAALAWLDRALPLREAKPDQPTDKPDEPADRSVAAALPATIASAPHPATATHDTPAPKPAVATLAVREPAPLPDNPNPSHVHLVLDEGAQRIVVTVAVRGSEVNVGIRAGDDNVAAALARNAATLDHAMRAQGLDLDTFSAERDRDHEHHTDDEEEPA